MIMKKILIDIANRRPRDTTLVDPRATLVISWQQKIGDQIICAGVAHVLAEIDWITEAHAAPYALLSLPRLLLKSWGCLPLRLRDALSDGCGVRVRAETFLGRFGFRFLQAEEPLQLTGAGRVPEFAQRLGFDLPDAFARDLV